MLPCSTISSLAGLPLRMNEESKLMAAFQAPALMWILHTKRAIKPTHNSQNMFLPVKQAA